MSDARADSDEQDAVEPRFVLKVVVLALAIYAAFGPWTYVSDARTPSGEPELKGAVLLRGSEDAISSTTPAVQTRAES